MTQPPDDHTQRFDPFRDDDSTRAMPPVPPAGGDDSTRVMPQLPPDDEDTRFFPFGDDRTRQFPAVDPRAADATRPYPAQPGATAAMPPSAGGQARGSATPPPPGGYGGTGYTPYEDDQPESGRDTKRAALIIGGIVLAILLVTGLGVLAGTKIFGTSSSDPTVAAPLTPVPSPSVSETPSESPSPTETTVSPPPPEGPGPRILSVDAPATVDCSGGGNQSVTLTWRVRDADKVDVSIDGAHHQSYAPDDQQVSLPFPCDGQAHRYQVVAFSNSDRQSQPRQVVVRPEASPSPSAQGLFPAPSAS